MMICIIPMSMILPSAAGMPMSMCMNPAFMFTVIRRTFIIVIRTDAVEHHGRARSRPSRKKGMDLPQSPADAPVRSGKMRHVGNTA